MLPIIASVFGVFLIIATGAVCRQCNWLTREADRSLTNLTTRVLLPMYFVNKILNIGVTGESVPESSSSILLLIPPAFGFVATASGFAIAYFLARQIGPKIGIVTDASQRAFALCVGICNYGYIPYPLAERFYPDAMIDLILHNVGVELALWSIGILIISGGEVASRALNHGSAIVPAWKRVLFSGPLLAVVVATLLRAIGAGPWIPSPVFFAINAIASAAIPMGLMICGAIIVDYIGEFLRGPLSRSSIPVMVSAITIRQVVMPILMLGATRLLVDGDPESALSDTHILEVMVLQAAMPVALFPIVLVQLYEQDTRTAIEVLISTTIAAIIAIPAWLAIGTWWLGP
ncbi:Membrane transport protein [Rubripirellula obstinata]|uniref:Membrane transport protein n=1 Tax=Rubripirellula obstinata TaxID=406547 RepID=A0A5B1C9F7_9BACT|nr:AEC family transporter [Rubripirellula obstinata]KAA1257767.1 Membrane transport protein [Rubripirellula obstinata]